MTGRTPGYDAIVVGARCAGSPTAMLLAGRGMRVLLVDRATFPSDTVSTHLVHPPGVSALRRWGLLDHVVATGCPPIDTYHIDFGALALTGTPGPPESPVAYAPRRTALDKILLDAAGRAGAEIREGFTVTEILVDGGRVTGIRGHGRGGRAVTETAHLVVGADGLRSLVARTVRPAQYAEKPRLLAGYYAYWSGLAMHGRFETYTRPGRAFAAWPTADDLTVVIGGWPYAEFDHNRADVEGNYRALFDLAPDFADRISHATMQGRIVGMAVPNFFRKPYGPGWVLVGDSGYHKDFITAQGIQDAFRDAELSADAVADFLDGRQTYDAAMARYHAVRDRHVQAIYELTTELATLHPPDPEMQHLLQAMQGNQEAMDGFVQVTAGVTSPADFFAEDNLAGLLAS